MSHTYNLRSGRRPAAAAVAAVVAAAPTHQKSYNLRSKGASRAASAAAAAAPQITMSASVAADEDVVGIVIHPTTHKVIGVLHANK